MVTHCLDFSFLYLKESEEEWDHFQFQGRTQKTASKNVWAYMGKTTPNLFFFVASPPETSSRLSKKQT